MYLVTQASGLGVNPTVNHYARISLTFFRLFWTIKRSKNKFTLAVYHCHL